MRPRARWDCALSIQRLEGSRPWLRRTRALWGFNNGKERVCGCVEAVPRSATDKRVRLKEDCVETVRRRVELVEREERVCSAASQGDTERAEAHGVFGLARVVSCCSRDRGWRAKLDFGSGKPLDEHHRATTDGARPRIA
jgi:hypothetical protein